MSITRCAYGIALATLAAVTGPVYAITGNWVEDFEHPYVGLVVFYDAAGEFQRG